MASSIEKTFKPNGFAIRSWGDILAVLSIAILLIAFIQWNLKIESELNVLRDGTARDVASIRADIGEIKAQIGTGILPRAEERLESLNRRVSELEDEK